VLDKNKKPLDPCHPARARKLLTKGRAAVFKMYPFTIIMKDRLLEDSVVHEHRVKIDPGSKATGIAVVQEATNRVVFAAEIEHRGHKIKAAMESRKNLRNNRHHRKTRYRKVRFLNRRHDAGWIPPPSLESRIANITTWASRIRKVCFVSNISMELISFDIQKMENPEISGVKYQQGTLFGFEVKEYLLEKFGRKCVYCGRNDCPLQVEHVVPKSRGGTNRITNQTLSCEGCNQKKGKMTAAEFGHPEVQALCKKPLKDAAAVNAIKWELLRRLKETGLPVECGSGGRTKFNRTNQHLPKEHWIDAACVGESTPDKLLLRNVKPLKIKAFGNGKRQRCRTDKYGFPRLHIRREKSFKGFQTGDIVKVAIPKGKFKGRYVGRITIRFGNSFHFCSFDVHLKYLTIIHRTDGYEYS
jgi:5-methylcytosine-specific restriction endonuclease McrA